MKNQILNILNKTLPKQCFIVVKEYKGCLGTNYIKILFAASDKLINNVSGQYPQVVSLSFNLDSFKLSPQMYAGCGHRVIYREPNLNDPSEKYLAMKGIKIPFRTPQRSEKNILSAIERFANNWIKALKENKETLCYKDLVNYDELLK